MAIGRDLLALLFGQGAVCFSADGRTNGLYLCGRRSALDPVIARLSGAGAWPGETKTIPAEQKPAYVEQMAFAACFLVEADVAVVRASHPRYPVDEDMWTLWRDLLEQT